MLMEQEGDECLLFNKSFPTCAYIYAVFPALLTQSIGKVQGLVKNYTNRPGFQGLFLVGLEKGPDCFGWLYTE